MGSLWHWQWLCLCLSLAWAFHDDDCEVAPDVPLDWRSFRETMQQGCSAAGEFLDILGSGTHWTGFEQCEMGAAAACLCRAQLSDVRVCIGSISLQRMLGSRWPLLKLLASLQQPTDDCRGLWHPSLDWNLWLEQVTAFAVDTGPWLDGETAMPGSMNEALGAAQGVIWKSSSDAMVQGQSIATWTARCPLGILSAYAVRAVSLVLGQNDVYRIVQRAIEGCANAMTRLEDILQSPWPIFQVLHLMSLMRQTLHDALLNPEDLEAGGPLWKRSASTLQGAGEVVIMTGLHPQRVDHLLDLFKHAHRLGYLKHLVVVPLQPDLAETCEAIAQVFGERHELTRPLCAPFVSQFHAKWLYLHIGIQLTLPVLWFDFHVVFLKPLLWLPAAVQGTLEAPPYREPCQHFCGAQGVPDMYMADEFYARFLVKPSLILLRPTSHTIRWLRTFLRWLWTYPFAHEARGLQYMVYPDRLDIVPSVSMLPSTEDVPRIQLGELDSEQSFVSTDGWFGEVEAVQALDISSWLPLPRRLHILETLRSGATSADALEAILSQSRKLISARRPTQRAYEQPSFASCSFRLVENAFMGGLAADLEESLNAADARCRCLHLGAACRGVTCDASACTVRKGQPFLATSPSQEWSFVKECSAGAGCNATKITRIVHVNYADGCCEQEQAQSSHTALSFGAAESRPLRGDFLDTDFRRKNQVLLMFNRTPELTQHKTPSGKIGYYVWKPYVILKTILDPKLPWETTAIAWTDAGIHFVGDMRPLVHDYLRDSDVAATRTPMNEGDFSKRDAFLLLDADYPIIMDTNQIATGFIMVRKTRLAIAFLERWLEACEERRIMTEEPSVLGYPEHPGYKNNNDDQTAFSLLFKLYGFRAFSVEERDAVVYTGRNLAKFIKASDDFAKGVATDREAYLQAADEAAQR